jgi:putative hydrolase of the HAD superfamily
LCLFAHCREHGRVLASGVLLVRTGLFVQAFGVLHSGMTHAPLSTIAFDADDTLWGHEEYYQLTQGQFATLLADFVDASVTEERLLETERRNLAIYGYGVKSFTLSMIETALELTESKLDASVIAAILERGRDLLAHPIEPLPGVRDVLSALKGRFRLIIITKGDLFDQERKLAQSGLGDFFDAIEIVSEKDAAVYARIFARFGGAASGMMVGNSLKSDILPALEAGAYGVHVPSSRNWALDHADEPEASERFRRIERIGDLAGLIETIRSVKP